MASGKKNYFRHSTSSFEDEKIQNAIDKLGYEGYAFYFILLELLARQCENEFKNPIRIHQQSLRNVWRKQTKSCIKVVTKLQESGLFVATFNESFVEFDIPNLAKYMGKYTIKNPPNVSNKKKVKESKVKENKYKGAEEIFLLWNAESKEQPEPTPETFRTIDSLCVKLLNENFGLAKIKTAIKNYFAVTRLESSWFNHRYTMKNFLTLKPIETFGVGFEIEKYMKKAINKPEKSKYD